MHDVIEFAQLQYNQVCRSYAIIEGYVTTI